MPGTRCVVRMLAVMALISRATCSGVMELLDRHAASRFAMAIKDNDSTQRGHTLNAVKALEYKTLM